MRRKKSHKEWDDKGEEEGKDMFAQGKRGGIKWRAEREEMELQGFLLLCQYAGIFLSFILFLLLFTHCPSKPVTLCIEPV